MITKNKRQRANCKDKKNLENSCLFNLDTPSENVSFSKAKLSFFSLSDVQESSRSSNNGIWFPSTRKCVSIFGHNLTLTNQNCGFKLPFICEAKPYCSCKFGANEYHCNRQITILSECCRHVFCDSQGRIK